MTNAEQYRVTKDTEFVPDEADLDQEQHTWPDGRPLTEANTEEYARRRKLGGRPSLGGRDGSSPSIAFRAPAELRARVEAIAQREGRPVSAIAREALEQYVDAH